MSSAPAPAATAKYCNLADAATFAGVSVKTLERLIAAGRLDVYRVGTRRLVELACVDQVVRAGRA